MKKNHSSHRYQQLVAGFAASSFALLGALSVLQHEANAVSADIADSAVVMTDYRSSTNCVVVKGRRSQQQSNYRVCRARY